MAGIVDGVNPKWLAALGILVIAGAGAFYFLRRSGPASPPVIESSYVGSRVCAGCHQEIAKSYRQTGMGRSFYRPRVENTVEDYSRRNNFRHQASDRAYT